ncbi:MAG: DUF4827 domain-containing protein [Bacteroidaceae bacterium]|nr:DUF4827 domain-containing protein [Bacteroidaceae bacterium]
MNNIKTLFTAVAAILIFTACEQTETYSEKKDKEKAAIEAYLSNTNAKIISEADFKANGCKTDTAKNEWVLLSKSSVYMQVANIGTFYDENKQMKNMQMKDGESKSILCRFTETNLITNTLLLSNLQYDYLFYPEMMTVTRSTDTYYGSFVTSSSVMYLAYSSTSVPAGWLVPLAYINIGRCSTADDEIAQIRLIVPHTQGQASASQYVYPCLYEITYQEGQ